MPKMHFKGLFKVSKTLNGSNSFKWTLNDFRYRIRLVDLQIAYKCYSVHEVPKTNFRGLFKGSKIWSAHSDFK